MLRLAAFTLIATLCAPALGWAQSGPPRPTLERIRQTGVIRLGYSDVAAPFSYLDGKGVLVGFSIDLCHRIVDMLREKENLPNLAIQHVMRTPSNRMTLLKDGTVDIDCSANTNTVERRQNAAFSYGFFLASTRFVSLTASKLDKISDLAGRTVVATSGSVNVGQLNVENRSRKLNIAVVAAANNDASFQLVGSGHAAAFVTDDILLATLVANTPNPQDYHLSGEAFGPVLPYGLMTRKDDLPFHAAVNDALRTILTGSEIGGLYTKWFTLPIPPHGVNLHVPFSDKLQALFAHPEEIPD